MEQQEHLAAFAWNDQPVGRPKVINDHYLRRLEELVSRSPRDYGYPFHRWSAQWLRRHLARETGLEVSDRHINRLLKQMGLSTRSPSPSSGFSSSQSSRCGITISDLSPVSSPVSQTQTTSSSPHHSL
ncbi:MAG: winged helix-turn-helix domain-containing protein [Oculatellaceae cyanobacterium Prado106]|nr:winged helix-turn-helix domain-containing protein [Oculatellaceae cyanobacterium Prado106]